MTPPFADLDAYYPHLKEFAHAALFDGVELPWQVLGRIGQYIRAHILDRGAEVGVRSLEGTRVMQRTLRIEETILNVESLVEIAEPTLVEGTEILLEAGAVLEPGAMIKGAAVIGAGTEVRQGAYLRGNVITGERCTLGHTTEVKNSVFMNHSEAGHFAYVGDSVLGSYVNLGAGTKLANLQLRKAADKLKEAFPPIRFRHDDVIYDTGTAKIGAFVGDHAELGCNCVTAPAAFLGAHCWVFANTTVMKGYYPPRTILR